MSMSSLGNGSDPRGSVPSSRSIRPLPRNPYELLSRPSSSSSRLSTEGSTSSGRSSGVLSKVQKRALVPKPNTQFLCEPQYQFALPEPPADLKCLNVELDCSEYGECTVTEFEKNYRPCLLSDPFHGIRLNLMDEGLYRKRGPLDRLSPEDEELLGSQAGAKSRFSSKEDAKAIGSGRKPISAPWLRRMMYDEYNVNKRPISAKRTSTVNLLKVERPKTREEMLQAIETSFVAAKKTPVHPTKKHLKPVNIAPLIPDFASMCNNNMLVRFDAPPLARHDRYKKDAKKEREAMETAFTVAHVTSSGTSLNETTKIFKYYLPTAIALRKRKERGERYDKSRDAVTEEYQVLRDYEFNSRQRSDDKDLAATYILAVGPNEQTIRYTELGVSSFLRKRPPNQPTVGEPRVLLERGELSTEQVRKRRKILVNTVQSFSESEAAAMADALEEDD